MGKLRMAAPPISQLSLLKADVTKVPARHLRDQGLMPRSRGTGRKIFGFMAPVKFGDS